MATAINIEDLKTLRSRLNTGVAATRAALIEADGDLAKATEILRLQGAKANLKKADRPTDQGLVAAASGPDSTVLIALGCETDFVAKNSRFLDLADAVLAAVSAAHADSVPVALAAPAEDGGTVEELISRESAVLGERIQLLKVALFRDEHTEVYLHRRSRDLPPQIGVVVSYSGGDADLAQGIAQHIAAYSPSVVAVDDIPETTIAEERRILEAIALKEGKAKEFIPKIIEGRLRALGESMALLEQEYARDGKAKVKNVLAGASMEIHSFERFAVGS